jgi:hypothetical protein
MQTHDNSQAAARLQDMMRHFPTIFSRWSGAEARLVELTTSHATLRIEARFLKRPGHLRISCIEPMFIHAPVAWVVEKLSVSLNSAGEFELKDTAESVHIVAGKVEIAEVNEPQGLRNERDA